MAQISRDVNFYVGFLPLFAAAFTVASCNQTAGPPAPTALANSRVPAPAHWPPLPEDAPCAKELRHFQAVLDGDVSTGNVNRSVYDQIGVELVPAADACAAGKGGESLSMIHTAKVKHGYAG